MSALRITLDQWSAFVAVVEAGSFAQAAAQLNKSQSSISYAVQQISLLLDVELLRAEGRRSVLTPAGKSLYRRARYLIEEAGALEAASRTAGTWESVVRLAVEVSFPPGALLECLRKFSAQSPATQVEVSELVLGHRTDALSSGRFDLALFNSPPPGHLGERLLSIDFVLVAHRDHELHRQAQPLTVRELRRHRHIVVRESSDDRDSPTTVQSTRRWTFSQISTSIEAVRNGDGYAWLPEPAIRQDLAEGRLVLLPTRDGSRRVVELHLVFSDRENAGPATRAMAQVLREHARSWSPQAPPDAAQETAPQPQLHSRPARPNH